MIRRAYPLLAATALGLAIIASPAAAQPAHAGISVPLPPPSITDPPPSDEKPKPKPKLGGPILKPSLLLVF